MQEPNEQEQTVVGESGTVYKTRKEPDENLGQRDVLVYEQDNDTETLVHEE